MLKQYSLCLLWLPFIAHASIIYETDYQTNALGQVVFLSNNSLMDKVSLSRFKYAYDRDGNISNIISLTQTGLKQSMAVSVYHYDAVDHLISDMENQLPTSYAFDLANNLRQVGSISRVYNERNELVSTSQGLSLGYDAAGNMLTTQGEYFAYNALNELTTYNGVVHYSYDGNGERLSKTTVLEQKSFYYQGITLVNSADSAQKGLTSYLFDTQRAAYIGQNQPQFYQYNLHGDVIQLTDAQGQLVDSYNADVYGKADQTNASDHNPYRYSGYYYDQEAKLYYLNARYYNPATQVFLTQDTYVGQASNPITLNHMLYVNGNPVYGVDRTGHMSQQAISMGIVGAAVTIGGFALGSAVGYVVGRSRAPQIRAEETQPLNPQNQESQLQLQSQQGLPVSLNELLAQKASLRHVFSELSTKQAYEALAMKDFLNKLQEVGLGKPSSNLFKYEVHLTNGRVIRKSARQVIQDGYSYVFEGNDNKQSIASTSELKMDEHLAKLSNPKLTKEDFEKEKSWFYSAVVDTQYDIYPNSASLRIDHIDYIMPLSNNSQPEKLLQD